MTNAADQVTSHQSEKDLQQSSAGCDGRARSAARALCRSGSAPIGESIIKYNGTLEAHPAGDHVFATAANGVLEHGRVAKARRLERFSCLLQCLSGEPRGRL